MCREQHWTSADGLDLYCRAYEAPAAVSAAAHAPTVLCLPGLTRNSRDFEDLAPHLAARFRVVCPDLRGRGFSARDPHWQNYHAGTYLADLQRLFQALDLQRVAIIGTSLGGLLGMMLGATDPDRVAGLVLDVGDPWRALGPPEREHARAHAARETRSRARHCRQSGTCAASR